MGRIVRPYFPGKRRSNLKPPIISEKDYRKLIAEGKRIQAGTKVTQPVVSEKSLRQVGIRFNPDGSITIPFYAGQDANVHKAGVRTVKSIPQGVRMVHHQIETVKLRSTQAKMICDEVSHLHWNLNHNWKGFSLEQKSAFTKYFFGLIEKLSKNPVFLRDPNKIHAAERFVSTVKLLKENNESAAAATMIGIAHNMMNWSRKMTLQLPRLERRMSLVVGKKFEMDTKIFSSVDALRLIYNQLSHGIEQRSINVVTNELRKSVRDLEATGLSVFKTQAMTVKQATTLLEQGKLNEARTAIKSANRGIVLEASKMSSIYPDKLSEVRRSNDAGFKTMVLSNQLNLFKDMMYLWWNPKNKAKSKIILETISELSKLAEDSKRTEIAKAIKDAHYSLENNSVENFAACFDNAVKML